MSLELHLNLAKSDCCNILRRTATDDELRRMKNNQQPQHHPLQTDQPGGGENPFSDPFEEIDDLKFDATVNNVPLQSPTTNDNIMSYYPSDNTNSTNIKTGYIPPTDENLAAEARTNSKWSKLCQAAIVKCTICLTSTFSFLSKSSHPIPAFFHILFKTLALVLYIFGGVFKHNKIFVTVMCILLHAADFWVTKNVTGRLLVSLRWWNKILEDGSTQWIFESAPTNSNISLTKSVDYKYFWGVLYLFPVIWFCLLIVGLLKFNFGWLIIVICGLVLNGANLYGYWQCSKDQKDKVNQLMKQGAMSAVSTAFSFGMFGGNNQSNMANGQQRNSSGMTMV